MCQIIRTIFHYFTRPSVFFGVNLKEDHRAQVSKTANVSQHTLTTVNFYPVKSQNDCEIHTSKNWLVSCRLNSIETDSDDEGGEVTERPF